MATLKETQIKLLTVSGAVTTDNKAGQLFYIHFTGATAGDKVFVKDGTTNKMCLTIPANNGNVEFNPNQGKFPIFKTDIECSAVASGAFQATFIYSEVAI